MTIEITKTNANLINKMSENGKSYSAIRQAMLALDMVENAEQADEYLATVPGIKKGARRGLTDRMYDFLKEAPRTQLEFYAWIKENGTGNTWKWRKTSDKVCELANDLHVRLSGIEFTDELYIEVKDEVEAA